MRTGEEPNKEYEYKSMKINNIGTEAAKEVVRDFYSKLADLTVALEWSVPDADKLYQEIGPLNVLSYVYCRGPFEHELIEKINKFLDLFIVHAFSRFSVLIDKLIIFRRTCAQLLNSKVFGVG